MQWLATMSTEGLHCTMAMCPKERILALSGDNNRLMDTAGLFPGFSCVGGAEGCARVRSTCKEADYEESTIDGKECHHHAERLVYALWRLTNPASKPFTSYITRKSCKSCRSYFDEMNLEYGHEINLIAPYITYEIPQNSWVD